MLPETRDLVSRAGQLPGDFHTRGEAAHARGVDKNAVALAALHHLGVAGDDLHARLPGSCCHGLDDASQVRQRQALLEDETCAQVERHRPAHGDIVDRAVHRQAAYIAPGEEKRRYHVGVGGHYHPARRHIKTGLVVGPV